MDIDLVNDLRREDDESDAEDSNDVKRQKKQNKDVSNDDDDEEKDEDDEKEVDVKKVMKKANEVAKKKVTKKPRPKLDVDRLTGPRGLNELCNLFKTEKFKGKGYEFVDLETLMHKYEYWAHRLVPHMAFDDFIEKAENLGGKKAVKNALHRLRDQFNTHPLIDDDDELASRTLIDLLPSIAQDENQTPIATAVIPEKNVHDDVPNDDELNELFQ